MKKWGWLLLGLVVILFFFTREGFQNTQKIKGPPYDQSDYPTIIGLMDPNWVSSFPTDPSTPEGQNTIASKVTPILGQFHTDVYQPASATLKESDVDSFLRTNTSLYNVTDKAYVKSLLMAYFVNQPHGDANLAQTASQVASANYSQSSGYADILRQLEQGVTGSGSSAGPTGPSGPTGPPRGSGASGSSGASGPSGPSNSSSSAWRSANTAGAGNQKVWGPRFNGLGMGSGFGGGDDTRGYPTLLGPTPKPSTMVEGAGIIRDPRGHGSGSGSGSGGPDSNTPSSSSLGSNPDNQYLPYSRTPGDKDLIPDPYRNPSNFSTSGESRKMEPIPFLTDFSAFMK
jgi:hypothetical protein